MSLLLDDGKTIAFGQSLAEVEQLFDCTAVNNPSPVARKGTDKIIRVKNLSMEFDSGKLHTIDFESGYEFKNPPTPYREAWKNFAVIGPKATIRGGMAREDFLAYLAAWEQRAVSLGAERMESGDLTSVQFAVLIDRDQFADMMHISMGPSRRSGGGGIWCDGWTLLFGMESGRRDERQKVGSLRSLSAFCDEFNTVARGPVLR
jgi:hypothetical protein